VANNVRSSKDIAPFFSSTNSGNSGSNLADGGENDRQSIWASHCRKDEGVEVDARSMVHDANESMFAMRRLSDEDHGREHVKQGSVEDEGAAMVAGESIPSPKHSQSI